MTSPYAPLDTAASRRIKAVGIGLQAVAGKTPTLDPDWGRLSIAMTTLGLPTEWIHRTLEPDLVDEVAARIRLHHGRPRQDEFRWWIALGHARSSASEAALEQAADRLMACAEPLGLQDALRPSLQRLVDDQEASVEQRVNHVEATADAHLALVEGLRFGAIPHLELSYPMAYRAAVNLGELRAAHLLQTVGSSRRLALELLPALDALGLPETIPSGFDALIDAMAWVADPDTDADTEPIRPLWEWIDWYLEVGVGALAEVVYRAAHDRVVLGHGDFRGVAFRRALGGLQAATRRLRSDALAPDLDALAREVAKQDTLHAPPPEALTRRIDRWLDAVVPHEGLNRMNQGRILAWTHAFRRYHLPVDVGAVERWLEQFPGQQRWVGEGLLDAVQFLSTEQVVHSAAFLVKSFGLSSLDGAALVCLSDDLDLGTRLRAAGVLLPEHTVPEAMDRDLKQLVFVDDVCVTGTRAIRALTHRLESLTDEHREKATASAWTVVFATATIAGIERVGRWLEAREISPRILVGREERLLSDLGWSEWDAGHLLDDSGALAQPGVHLANPLFSEHCTQWDGQDQAAARALCADIGYALLASIATQKGWSDARRRASALGYSGLQGRLVLGHRVPRTTLPCLWCDGAWNGRPWRSLFASR